MESGESSAEHLESVRSELRRLGYLNRGFERYLLQDAMRPRRPLRTLLLLTAKVGALAGLALALALAVLLLAANAPHGGLASLARDLPVLTLHLFPPIALATGAAFLVLCGLVVAVLRLYPVRHIETLALGAALAAGAGGLALALWRGRELVAGASASPWQLAAVAVAAPAVIYLVVKLAYHGLLGLAIRLTDAPPPRRLFSRRWLGFAILSAAFVLTLPAVLSARRTEPAPPSVLPTAPGERVLLVGIDGVLPEELDYLLQTGDLPFLARMIGGIEGGRGGASGGALLGYARRAEPPASFWTSVATGLPTPEHGVTALDSFLPRGAATPLARSGPLRAYWSGVEVPLRLAEHRPVLANRRSAFAVWELAARGGAPVAAIDWWSTFPAEPLPGLVVAHGAYQLLAEGTPGAVAPASAAPALAALAAQAAGPSGALEERRLTAALPAPAAAALLSLALRPDRFYREALARELAPGSPHPPRAAALYLPGLDIAAAGWRGGDVAFADLLRGELQATDGLLAQEVDAAAGAPTTAGDRIGTVAVVVDPGRRRSGGAGRIVLWRRAWRGSGCPTGSGGIAGSAGPRAISAISVEAVAAALLRAAGLPQSDELPLPPALCGPASWPPPPATVAGYGRPRREPPVAREGGEYLENLRSLGYL